MFAACPVGKVAIAGGYTVQSDFANMRIEGSWPDGRFWVVTYAHTGSPATGPVGDIDIYALCAVQAS